MLNSFSFKFVPPNFIDVLPVAESNFTSPVPASQFESVESFVQVPDTVHVSEPRSMDEEALEMLTLAATVTLPDVLVISPPLMVSTSPEPLMVMALVFLAKVPPEMVREVLVVSCEAKVRVPPEMTSVSKLEVASMVRLPVPEKVVEPLTVRAAILEVSQEPVDMVMVDEPFVVSVAAPDDVRLLAPKAGVAPDRVTVPVHVRLFPMVVLMPELTVRLLAVSSIETVPPDALTTTVEVPTVYTPPTELKLVTVIVLPLAVRMPPADVTVTVAALMARLEPDVLRAVVLEES